MVQVTADIEVLKKRVATNICNKTSEFPNRIVHPRQHLCLSAFVALYGRYGVKLKVFFPSKKKMKIFFFLLNNQQEYCYSCFRRMDCLRILLLHDLKLKRTQNISILA